MTLFDTLQRPTQHRRASTAASEADAGRCTGLEERSLVGDNGTEVDACICRQDRLSGRPHGGRDNTASWCWSMREESRVQCVESDGQMVRKAVAASTLPVIACRRRSCAKRASASGHGGHSDCILSRQRDQTSTTASNASRPQTFVSVSQRCAFHAVSPKNHTVGG